MSVAPVSYVTEWGPGKCGVRGVTTSLPLNGQDLDQNRCVLSKITEAGQHIEVYKNILGVFLVFINGGLQSKIDLNQPPYGDESHETYLNALEFHEIDFGSSDVLIIGGGNLGLAKLLLDKGVRGVTIFELDKEVVEIFLEYFPSVAGPTLEDERVKIEYGDGFDRLKLCTEDSFDVIIGDLTVSSALRFAEKEIQDDLISACKEGGAILTHWADGMLDLNLVFAGFHKACAPHFVCVVEIANYSNLCWSTKPFKSGVEYLSN